MATFAMVGLTLAATAMSIAGSIKEGEAQEAAAEANAKQAIENARLTRHQTTEAVRQEKYANMQALGSIRAAYGASGVTMDGTPDAFYEQSVAIAKYNENSIRYEGLLKERAYYREAGYARQSAGYYKSAATMKAIGQGLSGAQSGISHIYGNRASTYSPRTSSSMTRT